MFKLINRLLLKFKPQVVSKQQEYSLVDEAVKFLNSCPQECIYDVNFSEYVGEINYIEDKNGKTYYEDHKSQTYFCDYDMKNPSKEVLGHMIKETTFTKEQLDDKLNNG